MRLFKVKAPFKRQLKQGMPEKVEKIWAIQVYKFLILNYAEVCERYAIIAANHGLSLKTYAAFLGLTLKMYERF